MSELLLIRHCQSTGQEPSAPLTIPGQHQATALADRLEAEPIDYVLSSPYRRARDTIAPLAARRGLAVEVDARLAEHTLSAEPIDDWRDYVAASFTDPERRAPGGESGAETVARGWPVVESLLASGHRLPALVSHGLWISLILHRVSGDFGAAGWASLGNPDVFHLYEQSGRLRFRRLPEP